MRKGEGAHHRTKRQYQYFPVSYPSRRPLIHAMRPDRIGYTLCENRVESWTRIDTADVSCATCGRWIETQQAAVAS